MKATLYTPNFVHHRATRYGGQVPLRVLARRSLGEGVSAIPLSDFLEYPNDSKW